VSRNEVLRHPQWIDKYKVVIGKAISGHAGVLDNNGQAKIIATIKILPPKEICTQTYLVVGPYDTKEEAERVEAYLKTKFVRFLMMPQMLSISISRSTFQFVPDIGKDKMWNDDLLAQRYGLSSEEVAFIDSIIKEM
jgi:site-specific DNA-methyltransferase (adenine-specific)